jgi:DnaA family protein
MEQLTLDLLPPEPPSFASFLPGRSLEAWQRLGELARGERDDRVAFLWGAAGLGKTHLLRAAVAAAAQGGRPASYWAAGRGEPFPDAADHLLLAADDVERAGADEQARLFSLANELRSRAGLLLAASRLPLGELPLREDVRSRLGWGLSYELHPLSEEELPLALADHARSRGFRMPPEVIGYLLRHCPRDLPSLLNIMASLDRHSLALKRPITLPMLLAVLRTQERA